MDINQIIIDIVVIVIVPLAGILVKVLASYLLQETERVQEQTDSVILNKYIGLATDAVIQAVEYVAQTYVDALKAAGKFDKEAQKQAFNLAKEKALDILGLEAIEILNEIYGDFNTWIETKIEQTCRQLKQYSLSPGVIEVAEVQAV